MIAHGPGPGAWGFDPFRTAVALAVVAGAVSLALPWLVGLVGALAALAVAAWAADLPVHGRPSRTPRCVAAVAILGVAGLAFVGALGPTASYRGALLAVGLLPLWAVRRGVPTGRSER